MAAHVLTALGQIKNELENDQVCWTNLQAALLYASWTEDLKLEEYRQLMVIVDGEDVESLSSWVDKMMPYYRLVWELLGRPATREEWNKRRLEVDIKK